MAGQKPKVPTSVRGGTGVAALLLCLLTLAVFHPVTSFPFVNYDDPVYVVDNPVVRAGWTGSSVAAALTTPVDGNWHPVTVLSHVLDGELFGENAGGHHATSLGLHVANVLLLFLLLRELCGSVLGSGIVAALFAVHPLNVQSVAWVAERKNVLSTAFWLAALLAWVAFRRRPTLARYLLAALAFLLGLASKPALVTLPLTLVLVDLWLLARGEVQARGPFGAGARGLVLEKVPLLCLSALCALATLWAQSAAGAMPSYSLSVRVKNAVVACAWYLVKAVWPARLSVFYPHPGEGIETWKVVSSFLLLLGLAAAALGWGRRHLPVLGGLAWYLVTLLPMLGLVQVGSQAYADRYAYVPLMGIFVAVTWAASRPPRARRALALAAVPIVLALAWRSTQELDAWRDSARLFEKAVAVDADNTVALGNLGLALVESGRLQDALVRFRAAVRVKPEGAPERINLGNALAMSGDLHEAEREYRRALQADPGNPRAHYNLARLLAATGRGQEAVDHLRETLRREPHHEKAREELARLLSP